MRWILVEDINALSHDVIAAYAVRQKVDQFIKRLDARLVCVINNQTVRVAGQNIDWKRIQYR